MVLFLMVFLVFWNSAVLNLFSLWTSKHHPVRVIALGNSANLLGLGKDFSLAVSAKNLGENDQAKQDQVPLVLLLADWVMLGWIFNFMNLRIPSVKQWDLPIPPLSQSTLGYTKTSINSKELVQSLNFRIFNRSGWT